jgi:heme exporter protein B
MTRRLLLLLRRDLGLLLRGGQGRGGAVLPVLFFVAVAMLFPFAVGPDARLLARTGAGVVWIAALLAAILPLDRLIEPDLEAGLFDQWAIRGLSEELVLATRILAHWLSFGPPLMLATLPAGALLGLDGAALVATHLPIALPGAAEIAL